MSSDKFLVAEAQLIANQARQDKAKRLESFGEPIQLPGKALWIEVRNGAAWIAENTAVVKKIDLESGKVLQVYRGHAGPVTVIAFSDKERGSGDDKILISGSWDQSIKLWDTNTKHLLSSTPEAHADFIKTLLVLPTLQLLVSGGSDNIVRFWDLSSQETAQPLPNIGSISSHTRPIECLAGYPTSETSAVLYTADTMGVIKIWDVKKEFSQGATRWRSTLKAELNHHRTRINDLYVGEGLLWTASADETAQIIPENPHESPVLKVPKPITHPASVRALFPLSLTNLAEPYIITGAGDVIRVYDISTLEEPNLIAEVDAHWHDITAIRLWIRKSTGNDGLRRVEPWIVTTSLDQTIRKWKLEDLLNTSLVIGPPITIAETELKIKLDLSLTEEEERELADLLHEDYENGCPGSQETMCLTTV